MKNLFISCLLMLTLTSCSKYQISILSSTNTQKDAETGRFVTENDSVKITYSFFGQNAPINLDVYNKLNKPLYIDWQRSAFITGDKAVSYANDQIHITGEVSGSSIGNSTVQISQGNIDATAALPKSKTFIPPHTRVSNTLLQVSDEQYVDLPKSTFKKQEINSESISGTSEVQIGEFTGDKSPLSFKSYLTLYTLDDSRQKDLIYQHNFFVSKVIKTGENPQIFEFYQNQRGDFFYTQKATGFGKAATGVAIAAMAAGVASITGNQTGK